MDNKFKKVIDDIERLNGLDSKSIPEKVLKFNEEFGEFSQELIKLLGFTHKPFDEEHFVEESGDSLQVLLSIQLAACRLKGIDFERILDKVLEKDKKWEEKMKEYTRNNTCVKCGQPSPHYVCNECHNEQLSH